MSSPLDRRTLLAAAAGALTAAPALSQETPMPRLYAVQMAIIDAWHHQDVEGVLVHLTDDVVWRNSSGLNPAIRGKAAMRTVLQTMAKSGNYDALIALGAVIRGETYHFEIVSNESARGIMNVQLETGVPIANGVLTTEDDDQAEVRMMQKGADCAGAAVEMANLLRRIERLGK